MIKCKMCGGDLKILQNSTICECEYCGSKQTIPNTDDDKRLKLYERANKLRFENEFDKAAGVYESIVAEYQDEAEAYWGLVLCKYGIEYVDDPKTGRKIPTCHRSSFDSVMDDNNFDLVMENSDTVARGLYREEAKQIEELRKGIIEVSSKEEAYDIFICYKETAVDGQRTIDSVIAQDVYDALTDKGYRVFFSRITLEDKLGQEYEPYIFAALNSAKVMLVFGTTYDYYNSVWVKNEWSRFLQLMESGQKKTLIPCFKDIDAYDMPKEFAKLQAQDMGKVGAIQDLLRGIDKLFERDKNKFNSGVLSQSMSGDSASILKRGYFSLEDSEWDRALQFFDQALNSDAENPEIHLGIFLAKRQCSNLDMLIDRQIDNLSKVSSKSVLACKPYDDKINRIAEENKVDGYLSDKAIRDQFLFKLTYDSKKQSLEEGKALFDDSDWYKVERFAVGEFNTYIQSKKKKYLDEIDNRVKAEEEQDRISAKKIEKEYSIFVEQTEKSVIEQRFQAEAMRESYYIFLCDKFNKLNTKDEYQGLINELYSLNNYKESSELINLCNNKISEITKNEEKQREQIKEAQGKRIKKISKIIAVAIGLFIIGFSSYKLFEKKVIIPNQKYDEACKLLEDQKYDEALNIFENLNGYKDSENKIENIKATQTEIAEKELKDKLDKKYQSITEKIDADDYKGAIEDITSMEDKTSKNQLIDYCVQCLSQDFDDIDWIDGITRLNELHDSCISLMEMANEEQSSILIEKNDSACMRYAFSGDRMCYHTKIKDYNPANDAFELLINPEPYEDDISRYDMYADVVLEASIIRSLDGINYDKNKNILYIHRKDDLYYIITGDDSAVILGDTENEGTKRLTKDGALENLDEPLKQDAEKFFENYSE